MSKSLIAGLSMAALMATGVATAMAQSRAGDPLNAGPQGPRGDRGDRAAAPANTTPLDHADWSQDSNWLCKPGRQDACAVDMDSTIVKADGSTTVERFKADPNAPIDCFYVYPTVSNEKFSTSDLTVTVDERMVVLAQAARLSAHCKLYAPMYRQTTLTQLIANQEKLPLPPQRGAAGQGPADVLDAWNYYLQHDNHGRGVIILGHSQGAGVVARLVAQNVDGKDVQKQLVSAWVIGGSVTVPIGKDVGGTFKSIPACRSKTQLGCVVTYGSFNDFMPPPATGGVGAGRVTDTSEGLCVNPAALAGGKGEPRSYWDVPPVLNPAVTSAPRWTPKALVYTPFSTTPGLITTECVKKNNRTYLEVHVNAKSGDVRGSVIPGNVIRGGMPDPNWGLHNVDMNHSMGSFVDLVDSEGKAYAAAHGQKTPGKKPAAKAKAAPAKG
jgi:hypothetical protein